MSKKKTIESFDLDLPILLGKWARSLRDQAGWTGREAAKKLGITRNALAQLECSNNDSPRLTTLLRLSIVYGMTPTEGLQSLLEFCLGEAED